MWSIDETNQTQSHWSHVTHLSLWVTTHFLMFVSTDSGLFLSCYWYNKLVVATFTAIFYSTRPKPLSWNQWRITCIKLSLWRKWTVSRHNALVDKLTLDWCFLRKEENIPAPVTMSTRHGIPSFAFKFFNPFNILGGLVWLAVPLLSKSLHLWDETELACLVAHECEEENTPSLESFSGIGSRLDRSSKLQNILSFFDIW